MLSTAVRASLPAEGNRDTCTLLAAAWRAAWTSQLSHTWEDDTLTTCSCSTRRGPGRKAHIIRHENMSAKRETFFRRQNISTHWCVLRRWQAGWCRCCLCFVWWRRWRCCRAHQAPGLAWRGWTSTCPGGLICDCSGPVDRKWRWSHWSDSARPPAHPSVAPPRSPPHAPHGDQREATGLGTVATLHV